MPVSLRDVAAKVGVSANTVSCVLNNKRGAGISAATQERVRRTAQELGYRPNALARSLRTQRTNIIALYEGKGYINIRLPVFAELFSGLEAGCLLAKQDLLLHGNLRHASNEAAFAEIANGKVDGILLNTVPDDGLVQLLRDARFPLITLVDRIASLPCVIADVDSGCRLLAAHLAAKGHRRIIYRTPPDPTENIRTRTTAFQKAARAQGIEVTTTVAVDWTGAISYEETAMLQQTGPDRCTAVVGCTDVFAYPVCDACDELGLKIPEDIAVAGYNGVVPPLTPRWHLTTIRAPWADIGAKAVELLTAIIEGETVPDETLLPVELVTGDTT